MLKHLTPVVLLTALTACSTSMERRHANGNEDYLNAGTTHDLVIPKGLKSPVYSQEYKIPTLGPKASKAPVGNKLDIRPPLQILPMAEGTRVEEGADNIKIMVESVDNEIDLKKEIFDYLLDFLKQRNIAVTKADYAAGVIDTDWIEYNEVVESHLWGSDQIYKLRQRYQFDVQVRPHNRTGAIVIQLLEHEETYNGNKQDIALTSDDKRRYTIDMLNSAVAYMSFKREQAQKVKRVKQSLGIKILLEQGEKDEPAYYVAQADFDKVWNRLRIVLPEMGFAISDMDRSKNLMYLDYKQESGFWRSLWGDEDLTLKKGSYRLLLERTDNPDKTRLLLRTLANEPLDKAIITEMYKPFVDLMSEARKTH